MKRGPEYRVDRVESSGNASVPLSDFEAALRLRDGEPFAEARLDARADGFDAELQAGDLLVRGVLWDGTVFQGYVCDYHKPALRFYRFALPGQWPWPQWSEEVQH